MFERNLIRVSICLIFGAALCVSPSGLRGQATGPENKLAEVVWVNPKALIEQIESLKEIPQAANWAKETLTILNSINSDISRAQYDRSLSLIQEKRNQLNQIANAVWGNGRITQPEIVQRMQTTGELTRIGYRIDRRMAVWQLLQKEWNNELVSKYSKASFSQISFDGLNSDWVEYLRLRDFKDAFGALQSDERLQRKVSQEILARIYSPVLKPSQREFIQAAIDPTIIKHLKSHASQEVDRIKLLKRIEWFESKPNPVTGYSLNQDYQSLLWSDDPSQQAVAAVIDRHYRNANFRMTASQRLLNRLIPELPITQMPVSETIKGAKVSGNSQVSNRLRVAFEPNPNEIGLRLETAGYVFSDTIARTNTFRVANMGEGQFQVNQRLTIGPTSGINASSSPYSTSVGTQKVVGVQSKLDNVPLLGWMARRLAENKLRDDAPATNLMFRKKIQDSAESKMQQEVDIYVQKMRDYSYTNLFQPLLAMDLEPEAVQMASTQNQVVMRYRLAGRDQMAANSARPRDDGNNLLSFQLHQSAINNAIERVGLNGNEFTMDELKAHLAEVIGRPVNPSEESEDYALIKFARLSPIQIDFIDSRLNITLNLASLQVGEKGKTLTNVTMTVSYKPTSNGMQIKLVQDIEGTRKRRAGQKRLSFSERGLISSVMIKLFKEEYIFDSLPKKMSEKIGGQNLEISQLVVADGWLGVAFDDRHAPAVQASQPQPRFGGIRRVFNRR